MKSGTLCLFKTKENFNPLLAISLTKERFRNGNFFDEKWVMIAQKEEVSGRCDVLFEIMKDSLITKFSMKEFHDIHNNSLKIVNNINEQHKLNLSWFEILQLAAISEYHNNVEESFILNKSKDLFSFYNDVIKTYDF